MALQRQHDNTLRELKALQQSRAQLEQHVDVLVVEREMIKKQLNAARQARPEEIKVGVAGCSSSWLVSCRVQPEIRIGVAGCSSLLLVSCWVQPVIRIWGGWV